MVEGIERAVFGEVTADDVTRWLDQHVSRRLSLGVDTVMFRAGRQAAVYGLQVTNGLVIVAKVHRAADVERLVEAMAPSYGLLDMTVYGRQETWEDSPAGWPQQWENTGEQFRTDGRPTAQWSRLAAGRSDDLGTRATAPHGCQNEP